MRRRKDDQIADLTHQCQSLQGVIAQMKEALERGTKEKAALAKQAGMSEVYLHQVFAGRRNPSRDRLIGLCFGLSATLEEAVALSTQFGFSRIPVTGEDGLDDILGLLYIKDLLPLILADRGKSFVLADYLRQPMFVPESTRCRDLFAQMSARKMQVAIVVDEYGGTSGLVTMEALLESIVGNIQDEYDNEEAEATPVGEDGYTFDGDIDLPEAERILGCILSPGSEEDYDTLGGLMIGLLDRIPGPDEHPSVELSGFRFTVQQANERQILRVLAEKIPGEKPE